MSSMSLSVSRKRLRSPDFRGSDDSDSDDELPPFKLRKKYGTGFTFSSLLALPVAIKERLQNLAVWITELPVKRFFRMALRTGTNLGREVVLDEDDEDEDEVQEIEKDDPDRLYPLIQRLEQKLYSRSYKPHSEQNGSYSISSRFDPHRINRPSSKNWNSIYSSIGDYSSRESRTDNLKRSAVVSNPDTDIEILLGTKPKAPAPEADEIEILSESPSTKQKHVGSQKSLRSSRSFSAKISVPRTGRSQNSSVKKLQSSSSKEFTANQVVRLQEKAQYQLLLEKYMSGSHYHHIAKKPESVDAAVQPDIKFSGIHFKKEVLQQPVNNFIERYYRPCQLLTPEKAKQTSEKEPIETIKIDDHDEDELKIVKEVKLPRCKPKIRSTNYFSAEWLDELKAVLHEQTEERMQIVKEQERKLESYEKTRVLNQLKLELPDIEVIEPEFPELTPEMEAAVDHALNGAPEEKLCKITSDFLLRKDFDTLAALNWLNDLVINSYFDLIVARSKLEGYPSVHAYNTFFYSTYKAKGYASVRRWTRKLDIFSFDLNFVPIHLGVHWCLAVIDHRSKKVCYYDSMGEGEEQCLELLHEYLCLEYKDKKGEYLDPCTYTRETMKEIPQQMNGSDCGMFTLKYAEYISRDAEITFSQGHMQYFRRRMVYELLKGQLL